MNEQKQPAAPAAIDPLLEASYKRLISHAEDHVRLLVLRGRLTDPITQRLIIRATQALKLVAQCFAPSVEVEADEMLKSKKAKLNYGYDSGGVSLDGGPDGNLPGAALMQSVEGLLGGGTSDDETLTADPERNQQPYRVETLASRIWREAMTLLGEQAKKFKDERERGAQEHVVYLYAELDQAKARSDTVAIAQIQKWLDEAEKGAVEPPAPPPAAIEAHDNPMNALGSIEAA